LNICNECLNFSIISIYPDLSPLQTHPYALGIYPKLALLKQVSLAAAAKSGSGSDVITFFQVSAYVTIVSSIVTVIVIAPFSAIENG
jgi:hypothetical protein